MQLTLGHEEYEDQHEEGNGLFLPEVLVDEARVFAHTFVR